MSEEIKVDYGGLKRVHEDLEQARTALSELILSLPEGSSRSEAVDEFKDRAGDLRNLILLYQNKLQGDSENLYKAAESFPAKDKSIASQYYEGLSKSLYGSSLHQYG